MNMNNQENYDDPQFKRVLETCLKMEIKEVKERIEASQKEIAQQKIMIRAELNKRKQLKIKVAQMDKINTTLNESLTRLNTNISETSEILELMKANIDDQYKLNQIKMQEYEDLVNEYRDIWHTYHNMYEELPLAKIRKAVKINLQKLKIEYMVMEYKKKEAIKIIKQRERNDWLRTRAKIIEFATAMVERSKLQKKLMNLKANMVSSRKELQSVEMELQELRNKEEDQKKLRKQKVLDMGPPKINHVPYRETYSSSQKYLKIKHQWTQESLDDNISINTLILEELCINENIVTSPEIIEITHDNDVTSTAVQVKKSSNTTNTIVIENTDNEMNIASIASEAEERFEKADDDVDMTTNNDTNMKDIEEEIQILQEFKMRPSSCIKKAPVKHSATTNAQDEIQAKRVRFEIENSNDNSSNKIAPQPMDIVREVDSKSSSVPKIINVESVHYNIAPISASLNHPRSPSITSNNAMLSSIHSLECCGSISSFDFMSKGDTSSYQGSLCNFKLSPTKSDISVTYANKDVQMASTSKGAAQQNIKNQFGNNASQFTFDNFAKKTRDNFSLF